MNNLSYTGSFPSLAYARVITGNVIQKPDDEVWSLSDIGDERRRKFLTIPHSTRLSRILAK